MHHARARCWVHEDCLADLELSSACGPNPLDMQVLGGDWTGYGYGYSYGYSWGDGSGGGDGYGYSGSGGGGDGSGGGAGHGWGRWDSGVCGGGEVEGGQP